MNIAIVDDNPLDQHQLEQALQTYATIHGLSFEIRLFSSAEALIDGYQPLTYSLIFLDIYMDQMTGIEAASLIRRVDDDVLLVYQTTSEEHRAEAFETYASAYLIKPVSEAALFRTMDHLLHLRTGLEEKRFFFVCDRQKQSLPYREILALQTDGNYMIIHDTREKTYRVRMRFSEAEEEFSSDKRFLTIIRGVIVNLDHVQSISAGTCRMTGDLSFPVNIRRNKAIEQAWHTYNFEKLRHLPAGGDMP